MSSTPIARELASASLSPSDEEKMRGLPWCLASGTMNAIFVYWTFCGSVFLLFLDQLGMPKGQIGLILSLFPFCGVIALAFAPLATKLGRKRVYIACYGSRKIVFALIIFLPWIISLGGARTGIIFLFTIVGIFALLRALAETAVYPWTQEMVPNRVRGKFNAWSTVLALVAGAAAMLAAGKFIDAGTGLTRYLILMGVGSCIGLAGVMLMLKVPGGAPMPINLDREEHIANLLSAMRDRNFISYLGGFGALIVGVGLVFTFLPLYMKEHMGVQPGVVVGLEAAVMVGGALSSLIWGWLTDRFGSRPILLPAMMLNCAIPLAWLLLPRHVSHPVAWCAVLNFLYGVTGYGVALAAGRLLFNGVIPPEKNTQYTAIYYALTGIAGGTAPLLAGGMLSWLSGVHFTLGPLVLDSFAILFFTAFIVMVWGFSLFLSVKPDDVHSTREVWASLANRVYDWGRG